MIPLLTRRARRRAAAARAACYALGILLAPFGELGDRLGLRACALFGRYLDRATAAELLRGAVVLADLADLAGVDPYRIAPARPIEPAPEHRCTLACGMLSRPCGRRRMRGALSRVRLVPLFFFGAAMAFFMVAIIAGPEARDVGLAGCVLALVGLLDDLRSHVLDRKERRP